MAALFMSSACASGIGDDVIPLTAGETTFVSAGSAATTTTAVSGSTTRPARDVETATTVRAVTPSPITKQLRREIELDMNLGRAAFIEAASRPSSGDADELRPWFGEESLSRAASLLADLASSGRAARPGVAAVERIVVESVNPISDGAVIAVYCLSSDSVVYEVMTGIVIDDDVVASRWTGSLVRVSGTWRLNGGSHLGSFEGLECA